VDRLRQWDRALARIEAWAATGVLLAIVVAASAQALFFNLANRGVRTAASLLDAISWVDTFAQKGRPSFSAPCTRALTVWRPFWVSKRAAMPSRGKHAGISAIPFPSVSPIIADFVVMALTLPVPDSGDRVSEVGSTSTFQ
jgi:hypothetical protein